MKEIDTLLYNTLMKLINEMQNFNSRQQEIINKIGDVDNMLYRQLEVLKKIQEQTKSADFEEQEEIKRKIEEINKIIAK